MTTLLFAPVTWNIAETSRMVEIAKVCREQFDFTCRFMGYGGDYVHLITDAGFAYHPQQPQLTPQRIQELWKADRGERGGKMFTPQELITRAEGEIALIAQLQPAAVVMGFTLSMYISARAAKVPLVVVCPLPFTRPFFEAGLATWPAQYNVGPLRLLPSTWKDRFLNWAGPRLKLWTRPFNKAASHFGLPPFKYLVDLFAGDLTLVTHIPELSGLLKLPPNWYSVGPIFAKLEREIPPEIHALPTEKPLIYFAMGSSANRDVLIHIMQLLGELPYTVIAPIKAHLRGSNAAIPPNVHLFDWLPAHKVNPLAEVAVIHGGEGTVQTSCASGTPFVGIGLQPEQDWNIEFMARQGTAVRLPKYGVTKEQLHQAIEHLRLNQHVRQRATEIQALMAEWPGAFKVANFLAKQFKTMDTKLHETNSV
ncbi:MAG: glycosyl transferase [Ardenticatenaceae bacterium]|nr:MAG: glycosyl transferase [Ardenticatenaceae bacterium]